MRSSQNGKLPNVGRNPAAGMSVPDRVVTNDELAERMDTSDEWIQQRTGIKQRHFIDEEGVGASDLAVPAVKMACENAGIEVSNIDAI